MYLSGNSTFLYYFSRKNATKTLKLFVKQFLTFAGYSLLAGGLAAVMLLPEMYTLLQTHPADSSFPTKWKFYENFLDILGQQLPFAPTDRSERSAKSCSGGIIVLMCVILYIFRKKNAAQIQNFQTVFACFFDFQL